jgi:apolipoprotein D and lipocalin family protein
MKSIISLIAIFILSGCWSLTKSRNDFSLIWNPTVGMAATSRFNAVLFSGNWIVREGFEDDWDFDQFRFDVAEGSNLGTWKQPNAQARVRLSQLGVFFIDYIGQSHMDEEVVVLWVDERFRTAALAARNGHAAVIVDRKINGGLDRIEAARVLLRKNGFDISKLTAVEY